MNDRKPFKFTVEKEGRPNLAELNRPEDWGFPSDFTLTIRDAGDKVEFTVCDPEE